MASSVRTSSGGLACPIPDPPMGVDDESGGWDMTVLYEDPANPGTILEFPYRTLPADRPVNPTIPGYTTSWLGRIRSSSQTASPCGLSSS